ncbi:response regulator transcription factor [Pedobacter mucosus]|uniref:response regulator transcription factor n=1 Tax=Pedobacter mucosus TaxID=2895286 RepID=UPI001EE44AC1|nr:response regulator [Pedobacter mucosus]UKT66133.1 response regulator [Pedobacter mucosus]
MSKNIVVLEDDEGIRDVLEILLLSEGHEVNAFADISSFVANKPKDADLFLLDVMLPDGNGILVCNDLKKTQKTANIPVLMMSAHADFSALSLNCKADGFITKPFDINHFLDLVNEHLKEG